MGIYDSHSADVSGKVSLSNEVGKSSLVNERSLAIAHPFRLGKYGNQCRRKYDIAELQAWKHHL